jgi:hypothetical protein
MGTGGSPGTTGMLSPERGRNGGPPAFSHSRLWRALRDVGPEALHRAIEGWSIYPQRGLCSPSCLLPSAPLFTEHMNQQNSPGSHCQKAGRVHNALSGPLLARAWPPPCQGTVCSCNNPRTSTERLEESQADKVPITP